MCSLGKVTIHTQTHTHGYALVGNLMGYFAQRHFDESASADYMAAGAHSCKQTLALLVSSKALALNHWWTVNFSIHSVIFPLPVLLLHSFSFAQAHSHYTKSLTTFLNGYETGTLQTVVSVVNVFNAVIFNFWAQVALMHNISKIHHHRNINMRNICITEKCLICN